MHKDGMDCALDVIKIKKYSSKYLTVKAVWINLGYMGQPFVIDPKPSTFKIKLEDRKNWINITDKIYDKRTKPGVP